MTKQKRKIFVINYGRHVGKNFVIFAKNLIFQISLSMKAVFTRSRNVFLNQFSIPDNGN